MTTSFNDWPPPIPLGGNVIPNFPDNVFPIGIQNFVNGLSMSTETPTILAALNVLSGLATAAQGKYIVQVKNDYFEPVNLWTAVIMPPGGRKSAVQRTITLPFNQYEKQKKEKLQPVIAEITSKNASLEARIKEMRSRAAKANVIEYEKMEREISSLEAQKKEVPAIPQIWTSDVTPENLGTIMVANNERMAILSDESGIFDILAGRYSSGIPNLDLFLKSYSGTPARVNRGNREPDFLEHPTLSMGLTPQPDVMKSINKLSSFRGRGLLGRFLFGVPLSNIGSRNLNTDSLHPEIEQEYHDIILSILNHPIDHKSAHKLYLNEKAYEMWRLYALAIEIKMAEGGPLAFITDWAGKLPGQLARIAGLIHIARYALSAPSTVEISDTDMHSAIKIANCLEIHALCAFDLMGTDPALEGAKAILRWIEKNRWCQFTFRDCHYAHKSRFKKANEMQAAIDWLLEHYYIKEQEQEKKAYRPSRIFLVNPHLYMEE